MQWGRKDSLSWFIFTHCLRHFSEYGITVDLVPLFLSLLQIAAHGKNFCTSAKNAFMLIMRNIVRWDNLGFGCALLSLSLHCPKSKLSTSLFSIHLCLSLWLSLFSLSLSLSWKWYLNSFPLVLMQLHFIFHSIQENISNTSQF